MLSFFTIDWKNDAVVMIDQRLLPHEEVYREYRTVEGVCDAIKTMVIRGAPALGVAGALGVALGAVAAKSTNAAAFKEEILAVCDCIAATRPTAVNLFYGVERLRKALLQNGHLAIPDLKARLREEALAVLAEDIDLNIRLGKAGAPLIKEGDTVLTHCNAGALACARMGSALGVLYTAWDEGRRFQVFADETRPVLQGARLTAWELTKFGIPTTLITDNMAGAMMAQGRISKVLVGADRIAANGDTANKIGTYSLAILAKYHDIPFYVAAPSTTIDHKISHGKEIPIEERAAEEVTHVAGKQLAPSKAKVRNPAFDVTPASLITGIITELGVFKSPYSFLAHESR